MSDPKLQSASASLNLAAVGKRSAGTFSRAFAIVASTLAGTELRFAATDGVSPTMILPRMACGVVPVSRGSPTSISYSTHPRAQMSAAGPML